MTGNGVGDELDGIPILQTGAADGGEDPRGKNRTRRWSRLVVSMAKRTAHLAQPAKAVRMKGS